MIFFLYGADTYRSRKKLNELKNKFINDVDPTGANVEVIDGEKASVRAINDFLSPQSLFARRRMIIVENIFKNASSDCLGQLYDFLARQKEAGEGNIHIFIDESAPGERPNKEKKKLFTFLSKQKFAQEFKPLSINETFSLVKLELKERKVIMNDSTVMFFISAVGTDLWRIHNELDKLVSYKISLEGDKGADRMTIIDNKDIDEIVNADADLRIFSLTDALSSKNKALAAKILDDQDDSGVNDQYLLTMIIRQFKILVQIKEALMNGLTSRSVASELKLHPFVAQKGILQAKNYDFTELKRILAKLVDLDFEIKRGRADLKTELDLMMMKM